MVDAVVELKEDMFEVQEKCTGALTEIKLIREAIAAMQHEAYHAEGIVKMIADLTARIEELEGKRVFDERCRTCADLDTVIDERDEAYDEVDGLGEENKKLKSENERLKKLYALREEQYQALCKRFDDIETNKLIDINAKLRAENEQLKKTYREQEAEIDKQMKGRRDTEAELAEARERIARHEEYALERDEK